MQAIVLAGGRGTRLVPITDVVPKCLVEVRGRPMLEWVLEKMVSAGVSEVLLVVGYKRELVEDHFGPEFNGVKLGYFVQREQLGTAHAVSLCEDYVSGDFLVANGDVILGTRDYSKLTGEKGEAGSVVLAREVADPSRFGVLQVSGNDVVDLVEKPRPGTEPGRLVSTGAYRFGKDIFASIRQTPVSGRGEYEIVDSVLNYMATGKGVEYRMCEQPVVDVSSFEDLAKANLLKPGEFPE